MKQILRSPYQLLLLATGVLLLFIGLVGLIFPLIPGLLFLVLALMVIGKVFPSVKSWAGQNKTLSNVQQRIERLDGHSVLTMAKVAAFAVVQGAVATLVFTTRLLGRVVRGFKQGVTNVCTQLSTASLYFQVHIRVNHN
ncbi:MAG: DUF454 family protein, partial [Pseudomonadota bacterium]